MVVVNDDSAASVVSSAAVDLETVANGPDPAEKEERNSQDLEDAPDDASAAVSSEDSIDDCSYSR